MRWSGPLTVTLLVLSVANVRAQEAPPGMLFAASTRGQVYYWVECDNWKSLSEDNWVFYATRAEAEADGKHPSTVEACQAPFDAIPMVGEMDGSTMRAHFIGVGQGAATLLEFSCGAALIDTGGERVSPYIHSDTVLVHYLRDFFDRRSDLNKTLDLVWLTHPHVDHSAGMRDLFRSQNGLTVETFLNNGQDQSQNNDHEGGADDDVEVTLDDLPSDGLSNGQVDPIDCAGPETTDPVFTVLWGANDLPGLSNPNAQSAVARVDFGSASMLITGDLQTPALEPFVERYEGTDILDVDVYVVGHHGAANGTDLGLMRAMTPRLAVVQSGSRHRNGGSFTAEDHGHPRRVTMDLLRDDTDGVSLARPGVWIQEAPSETSWDGVCLRKAIYGTAWDGHIVVELRADGTIVRPRKVAVC